MNKPSQGVQLSVLDFYQRTKAATEEKLIATVILDNIRTKLTDFMETYDTLNICNMSKDGYM